MLRGEDAVDLVTALFGVRGPEVVQLHLAIYIAATRSEALRPQASEAIGELERLSRRVLERLSVPNAEEVAACVVATIAGSALVRLSGRRTDREEAVLLLRSLRSIFAGAAH